MKNILNYTLLVIAMVSFVFVACNRTEDPPPPILVSDILISQSAASLDIGDTLRLSVSILPSNADNQAVTWTSSNDTVATVCENGIVVARAGGTANITATSADGSNRNVVCVVTVDPGPEPPPSPIAVTGVRLSMNVGQIGIGHHGILVATIYPENATDRRLLWRTTNTNIVALHQEREGVFIAREFGEAYIIVTTLDGEFVDSCLVIVVPIPVDAIETRGTETLSFGDTATLAVFFTPEDATYRDITWSSSNSSVATVSEEGLVTAGTTEGVAHITVTLDSDPSIRATTVVTVLPPSRCVSGTPAFGATLGTVTPLTDQEWTIGNQVWSDALRAANCNKTTFFGGGDGIYYADCRSNLLTGRSQVTGQDTSWFEGDLFSWCAVYRFREELCPAPWRVPTPEDFRNLDIELGGTGLNNQSGQQQRLVEQYFNRWGGSPWSGYSLPTGPQQHNGQISYWWSQSPIENRPTSAISLTLFATGGIHPVGERTKFFGKPVRCVRDL